MQDVDRGCYEDGTEASDSIKGGKYLHYLRVLLATQDKLRSMDIHNILVYSPILLASIRNRDVAVWWLS